MITQRNIAAALLPIVGILLAISPAQSQLTEAEKLYEEALYQLEAVGNFEEATTLFDRVAKEYPEQKTTAAKALLKLGLCYERLGSQKAEEAYTRIISQFPDQAPQVAEARSRLTALHQQKEAVGQSVQLSTGEGGSSSLSLSPDGSKMAVLDMSIGQNIGVYDFNSKKVELVTRFRWAETPDDGWTAGAIWSPDGKELAYWKGDWKSDSGGVWASTLDGNARLLYGRASALMAPCQWLPDASGVVALVADSTGYTLGIVPISGGGFKALKALTEVGLNRHLLHPVASVSPDGRFIAFQDGAEGTRDIRVMSIDGQNTTVLTDHQADDAQPLWSPDGEHIAFKSNRHGNWALWAVNVREGAPYGDPFLIAPGMDATDLLNWSPAGIAYSRMIVVADVFRVPVDPSSGRPLGNPQQIAYTPTGSNIAPAWSPDGKRLAFVSNRGGGMAGPGFLVVIPAEGGTPSEFKIPMMYTYWTYFFQDLRWTPDGKVIAFVGSEGDQSRRIYRLRVETGTWETWPLERGGVRTEWSGDGTSYFVGVWGLKDHEQRGIIRCFPDKKATEHVYRPTNDSGFVYRGLRCSRDYKWLAFQQDNIRVVAVEIETGKSHVVTPDGYGLWAWSPDGRRLLVFSKDGTYSVGIEGGTPEKTDFLSRLPKGTEIRGMDWSPGGKEVAFCALSWNMTSHLMKAVIPEARR